jgi:hypothetical protein
MPLSLYSHDRPWITLCDDENPSGMEVIVRWFPIVEKTLDHEPWLEHDLLGVSE